ncbi:aspartate kinase [Streptomyces morookaense]|uniref:aspartate kinase n=1 Tax=Streptomyces morookaense TaxID=1970 RepID=UPI0033CA3716
MALIVQKYGGSSVRNTERIKHVAERVVAAHAEGHDVVVVVSAMGDTTDQLLRMAYEMGPVPSRRELDMLLTSGERISNALTAMAVHTLGVPACSFSGAQAGVITSSAHGRARIIGIEPWRVREALDHGTIAMVAGFQGVSRETREVTTLGRGGSDTTAIALAAALKADVCEIYTDVDGVYTADPRIVPDARQLQHLTYEAMQAMAAGGAKVLAPSSVAYASRHGVTVHVRSSADGDGPGTVVSAGAPEELRTPPAPFTGVAHDLSSAEVTMTAVPDRPGVTADVFGLLADAGAESDLVVHHAVPSPDGLRSDITLVLPASDAPAVLAALRRHRDGLGYEGVTYRDDIGRVSLVGSGMRERTGALTAFREALTGAGVPVGPVSASDTRISAVCRSPRLPEGIRALHEAFGLGAGVTVAQPAGGRRRRPS